jgi:hypothetical protein
LGFPPFLPIHVPTDSGSKKRREDYPIFHFKRSSPD